MYDTLSVDLNKVVILDSGSTIGQADVHIEACLRDFLSWEIFFTDAIPAMPYN